MFVADFHIHSKYSRATSKDMNLEDLDKWAKIKGIRVLGTGDFTHPEWLRHLKEKLETAEPGLYKLKNSDSTTRFILTAEISCIYSKANRVRKIHIIVFAPSMGAAEKVNAHLGRIGNLKSDGRPILGLDAKELAKIVLDISEDCLIVPAHCLLPDTYLHTEKGIKQIKDIREGDVVYTHKGHLKKVTEVFNRYYCGPLYTIKPFYFRLGLTTTPEHPYLVLRNDRYGGKNNYYGEQLKREYFTTKKPIWTEASKIKIGDILLFPRFNKEIQDKISLNIDQILHPIIVQHKENKIAPFGPKVNWLPRAINIDKDFCRLAGYYLAEGYTNSRDAIGFCFNEDEKDYTKDLQILMRKIFNLEPGQIRKKENCNGVEFIYFSKILVNVFKHLFYTPSQIKRAHTKAMPDWMLQLPIKKQAEIFRGWWRGDRGHTTSRVLMNQMKIILLRLGVIPSIHINTKKQYKLRGKHYIQERKISAKHDLFSFLGLSFFEDKFNLLKEEEFARWNYKTIRRNGWIDENYIYLPVKEIQKNTHRGKVYNLEVEKDNSYVSEFATVHNCWTPWFSIFGSRSGFNTIEECFEEYAKYIFAVETGLSCYDTKTAVLTENGWKKFSQVAKKDKVCTLNLDTEEIEYQKPQAIYRSKYQGKMYRLKTKRVDLLVTPNHNLLYAPADFRTRRSYRLKEAHNLFGKSKILRKDGVWKGETLQYFTLPEIKIRHGNKFYSGFRNRQAKKFPIKPWLKFFGFWIAEGWTTEGKNGHYAVCISNQNYKLMNEMKYILESFGYTIFWDKKITNTIRVRDYQLFHYLRQFGKASNKYIPAEVKGLSKEFLEILLKYYIKGDGHVYGRSGKGLSATTISVHLRDDLQEIALKIGISAYYKLHNKKGTLFFSPSQKKEYRQSADSWNIYFIRRNRHAIIPSEMKKYGHKEEWVDYDGMVYCVSLPNRVVYIRRNGIPLWCGNSDPAMNWRLSALDKITLISNSDAHSPSRLGREANVLETELSYPAIIDAIKSKNPQKFLYTIEFFPEEGKYHYDGHRNCEIRLTPKESRKYNNICPRCGKPLIIGVLNRVEELADRPENFKPAGTIPFKSLIPLEQIIADVLGVGTASKKVGEEYKNLIKKFGSELNILLNAAPSELKAGASPEIAEGITRVREGKVFIEPGYDGVYGKVRIFSQGEQKNISKQKTLF